MLSILDEHDQDPAEGIDYKGFQHILSSLYIGRTFDDLVDRAFDVFASEGKGHITMKGLKRITKDVGQAIDDEELEDMIRMFDKNEDGVIDKVRDTQGVWLAVLLRSGMTAEGVGTPLLKYLSY